MMNCWHWMKIVSSVVNYDDLVSHVKAQKPVYFDPKLQKDYTLVT